jgi:hypothetical protein
MEDQPIKLLVVMIEILKVLAWSGSTVFGSFASLALKYTPIMLLPL